MDCFEKTLITQLDTRKNTLPTSMLMKVVDNLHLMSRMLLSCFGPSSGHGLENGKGPGWGPGKGLVRDCSNR